MVTRSHILQEIKRTAAESGGLPPGMQRFRAETGIKEGEWRGRYWARWGDALKEAGFQPNRFQTRLHDNHLFEKLVPLIRELKRFPVDAELRLKRQEGEDKRCQEPFRIGLS